MAQESAPWLLEALPFRKVERLLTPTWLLERVKPAPPDISRHVEAQGLKLRGGVFPHVALFEAAVEMIALVPSLETVVADLVADVHVLVADPGYDVSHSEPQWRSRIFLSIPDRLDGVGALRLAESVIHEAMHLNLTLFEGETPIVADATGVMASPWRSERRPYGGVAHGLFVFSCLYAYFNRVTFFYQSGAGLAHVRLRINDIRDEVASIDLERLAGGLTAAGSTLVRSWSRSVLNVINPVASSAR